MRSSDWNIVRLGEVLTQQTDAVRVEGHKLYPNFGLYSFGKGLFPKTPIDGSETSAKKLFQASANQIVYSRLFAFEGAYGLVPAELDGAFVSNEFPLFDCDTEIAVPEFLGLYLNRATVWKKLANLTKGMGNRRRRLKPDSFLAHQLPLPPLGEQRQIVESLTAISDKIHEAKRLHEKSVIECGVLCSSLIFNESSEQVRMKPIHELVRQRSHDVEVDAGASYTFAGVYCFGRGVFVGDTKTGMEFSYKKLGKLRAGDFIYPKLMAWEGALGIVPNECDGLYVSPEYPIFEIDHDKILPETLDVYFKSPSVWPELARISSGTNVRRKRLHPTAFLNLELPLPSMDTQRRIRSVVAALRKLVEPQSRVLKSIDSLIPSALEAAFDRTVSKQLSKPEGNGAIDVVPEFRWPQSEWPHVASAALVVSELWEQATFGRTKLEKLTHLIEYECGVDLSRTPTRQAAGPADFGAILATEHQAAKLKWFQTHKREGKDGRSRYVYIPGPNIQEGVNQAKELLGDQLDNASKLIDLMRPLQTRTCEVIATLYASWNDFLLRSETPTDNDLIKDVRENWHESKTEIPLASWKRGLKIMRSNDLVPKGTGKPVRQVGKKPKVK